MKNFEQNKDLSNYNTLAIPSRCEQFLEIETYEDALDICQYLLEQKKDFYILGGGSNLVMADAISGLVIKVSLRGIETVFEDSECVNIEVQAGENWHEFVEYTVNKGLAGLENLALIPGTVGASPVQNIGAYGVEVCDHLVSVSAIDIQTGQRCRLKNAECQFEYRDSIFKREEGRYLITSVVFSLNKQFKPRLDYGPLKNLQDNESLTPKDVFESVMAIRSEKLPDPAICPNAGSFFKNPVIPKDSVQDLLAGHSDLVWFDLGDTAKLAAGWLIDSVGLKGKENSAGVGCYHKQALVLVNSRKASFEAVNQWAEQVKAAVYSKYGVLLEQEPRVWK